jgi:hypothetical protein
MCLQGNGSTSSRRSRTAPECPNSDRLIFKRPRSGASISRFIPGAILDLFECRAWPVDARDDARGPGGSARADIAARCGTDVSLDSLDDEIITLRHRSAHAKLRLETAYTGLRISWVSFEPPLGFDEIGVAASQIFTHKILPSSSLPSMKSPKSKRISYVKAGVLIVDQVEPAILKGTALRFNLSKGKGIK